MKMSLIKPILIPVLLTFLTLFSCAEDKPESPSIKVENSRKIIYFKESNSTLDKDAIIYGAKYCKTVAEQMLEEAIKSNCLEVEELTNKAILNSQMSLESIDINEANLYFKKAEKLIYQAVDLMADCDKVNYNDHLYKA